ncbi:MAG TPA: PAS domain S-box protein [Mucilaginibacter sp.]|nr:PAS domain S-box protein [Mucilaginibacter sp.]
MATDKRDYRILVIEDNAGDFELVEDFLFEHIIAPKITQVTSFSSAREVLEQCSFDVLLLDLSLPDSNGEALISGINEVANDAPVIVLTGYVDFAFGIKSLSLGASDYILKDELTPMSLYKSIIYSIERKKITNALERSEKRYSDLFNLSPLPMWVVDVDTLKFINVNLSTTNHYGFSKEEFLSMTLYDVRPSEENSNLEKWIKEDRENPHASPLRLVKHRKKNGEIIDVELQIAPIKYKGLRANIVIANDVTQRFKYIAAIEDQNEKLKEISWIQSHVVRAPLSRLMGLIPLLEVCDETDEERNKILQFILTSAYELDDIVKSITDKSRVEDFPELVEKNKKPDHED